MQEARGVMDSERQSGQHTARYGEGHKQQLTSKGSASPSCLGRSAPHCIQHISLTEPQLEQLHASNIQAPRFLGFRVHVLP